MGKMPRWKTQPADWFGGCSAPPRARQHTDRRRLQWREAGRITAIAPMAGLAAIICVGIGVDFSGQTQLEQDLRDTASYCARMSTAAVPIGVAVSSQIVHATAEQCLSDQGLAGTVAVGGDRVTVEVRSSYDTRLLSIVAIEHLPVRAIGSANLNAGR